MKLTQSKLSQLFTYPPHLLLYRAVPSAAPRSRAPNRLLWMPSIRASNTIAALPMGGNSSRTTMIQRYSLCAALLTTKKKNKKSFLMPVRAARLCCLCYIYIYIYIPHIYIYNIMITIIQFGSFTHTHIYI